MNYTRWTDDELRRVLGANPKDLDAVLEGAMRYERGPSYSETEDLEKEIQRLNDELEDARAEAKGWFDDYEAEQKRAAELAAEVDRLTDEKVALQARIDELESSGAGLL